MGAKKSKISYRRSPQPSYEAAYRLDPDLQFFDSTLRDRTSRVINSHTAVGVEDCTHSLDSVTEVSDSFRKITTEILEGILECKDDIWKNQGLVFLVKDYFETTLHTLNFCTALLECLEGARHSQLIIQNAMQQFVEEQKRNGGGGRDKYSRSLLKELNKFKIEADPLLKFFRLFKPVYYKQFSMLEKFKKKKNKLVKKLKSMKTWRRVCMSTFVATFASVLICSVVVVAFAAPPVLAAVVAAAAVPLGSIGGWLHSIWTNYESEVKRQRDFVNSMQTDTYIAIQGLDCIRELVDKLEINIKGLLKNAEEAEAEAVAIPIDEIRKTSDGFMRTIKDLGQRTGKCSRDISKARTVILEKIENYPNT